MRPIVLMLALFALPYATADAAGQEVMSAADLQQLCAGSDHVSKNVCRVYILGVTQGLALGLSLANGKTHGTRPCVPAQISGESLEDTVKAKLDKRLAANPAEGDQEAAGVIAAALASAYPCTAGAH